MNEKKKKENKIQRLNETIKLLQIMYAHILRWKQFAFRKKNSPLSEFFLAGGVRCTLYNGLRNKLRFQLYDIICCIAMWLGMRCTLYERMYLAVHSRSIFHYLRSLPIYPPLFISFPMCCHFHCKHKHTKVVLRMKHLTLSIIRLRLMCCAVPFAVNAYTLFTGYSIWIRIIIYVIER